MVLDWLKFTGLLRIAPVVVEEEEVWWPLYSQKFERLWEAFPKVGRTVGVSYYLVRNGGTLVSCLDAIHSMPIFLFFWSTLCWKCGGRTWCGERCSCSLAHRWPSLDQLMLFFQLFLPFSLLNPFLFLLHQACSYPVYSCIHQFLPRLYVEEKIHEKVVRQRYDLVHIFCIPTPPLIASWFMYLTAKYTTKFLPSSCDFFYLRARAPNTLLNCRNTNTR